MLNFFTSAAVCAFVTSAAACDIRLKQSVPICPAVTYGPEDCETTLWGKVGDHVEHPASIHIMTNGRSYFCPSHGSCIELQNLSFKGCKFTFIDRKAGETKNYASHLVVE